MEADPYINIWCQPSYAAKKVLVEWTLQTGWENEKVYVYRSQTGTKPWDCLNVDAPAAGNGNFEDGLMVVENRVQDVHYRLLIVKDGVEYGSPPVNLLQQLPRSQFGAVRKMVTAMLRDMRAGNGVQVFHYQTSPGKYGDVDAHTGQVLAAPCPQDGVDGFLPPVQTWIRFATKSRHTQKDRPEGDGMDESVLQGAVMLPFPKPARGHVIVNPTSDDRFAVDTIVNASRFRGIVAISYEVTLRLLARDDERYKLVVPSLLKHP